ncbi:Threonylcarbamoyladenosine tRNA methylthiotransferase [Anabarilius grahami]|uniref:Threonylcarbamoyladenosine tRNA methylthiotransferase n=1 Tax=Anabarilius grahami TaxID=495550 RepID=A0A3N0ZA79_ANAGA|nr:Threonylcarbamoyladenosine tRNA methylthiotransferase [Anabarilius grahami]
MRKHMKSKHQSNEERQLSITAFTTASLRGSDQLGIVLGSEVAVAPPLTINSVLSPGQSCLNACTYCKTKHARGDLASYPIEELVERARQSFQERSESGTVLFLFFLSALVGVEWGSQLTAGQTEGLLWDVVAIPLSQVAFKCSLQVKGQVLPACHLLCPLHSLSKHI